MPNWIFHFSIDALVIFAIFFCWKDEFLKNKHWVIWGIFLSNLIDIDHLLASPIYDQLRCGINFHPLHSWFMLPLYVAGLFHPKLRYVCIGILLHLMMDSFDCVFIAMNLR